MPSTTSSDAEHDEPRASPRLSGWEIRLVTLLSVIAGMVDLIGFMTLGNIFTAHITGNLVLISAAFLREVNPAQALAIPVFFIAVAATWLIARVTGRHGRTLARLLLSVQLLLLAGVLGASVATGASARPQSVIAGTIAMIAVCAMATQHALLRLTVPNAPSTAVMTGNVTNAILALLDALSSGKPLREVAAERRFLRSLILLVAFLGGCVSAAVAVYFWADWAWLLPVALAAAAVVLR
jgi:uncharacterized membrane protein YoaK (UPF0700 family)